MSAKMKHALFHLLIWLTVTVLFLGVFFSNNTIAEWGDNRTKTLMLAVLLGVGLAGGTVLNYIYRERDDRIVSDERDEAVMCRAMRAGFVTVVLAVYISLITLYVLYENAGYVPVGWLWIAAYGLVIAANTSVAAFTVYYYSKSE